MTPAEIKQTLDLISNSSPHRSWLDRDFNGTPYTVPGTTTHAYRYSYTAANNQREAKLSAEEFERRAKALG